MATQNLFLSQGFHARTSLVSVTLLSYIGKFNNCFICGYFTNLKSESMNNTNKFNCPFVMELSINFLLLMLFFEGRKLLRHFLYFKLEVQIDGLLQLGYFYFYYILDQVLPPT